jgi:hypothetical protein
MKRLITSIGFTVLLAVNGMAQSAATRFEFRSFLNVTSFATGTNSTFGFTNLLSPFAAGYSQTNQDGTMFTNLQGNIVVSGSSNNALNIFKDVDLWSLRNGDWPVMWNTNNQQAEYLNKPVGLARLVVRGVSTNAAGTGPVVLRFIPLWDGTNESTLAGDVLSISFVPNGVTAFCLTTNFPMQNFVGARRVRLREEYNTSASNQGQSWITELGIAAWIP